MSVDVPDDGEIFRLIGARDETIQQHLQSLANQNLASELNAFATAELAINQKLIKFTQQLQADVLKQASEFLRNRKSVQKYQQG